MVDIVTDSTGDITQLATLGAHDALIVISEHGNYARAVQSVFAGSRIPRVLITVDADADIEDAFTFAVRLSPEPQAAGRTVFAQYGITYLLDLLYNRYYTIYGEHAAE